MVRQRPQRLHLNLRVGMRMGINALIDRGQPDYHRLDTYNRPGCRNEFSHFDRALKRCKQTQVHIRRAV